MDVTPARRTLIPLLLAATLALLAAAPAQAAKRKVPAGFMGMNYDREILGGGYGFQDGQWDLMASSGVESVRALVNWNIMQHTRKGPIHYELLDGNVARAAMRNQRLLFTVVYAPPWARLYPKRPSSPPKHTATYASFLRKLVQRYGPDGDFWPEHPNLPFRPVREWQIWNEPHLAAYWDVSPRKKQGFPRGYRPFLRAGYKAIKKEDGGATVVMAGMTGKAWDNVSAVLRDRSMNRYFNVAALQTYPQTPSRAARATQLMRIALQRARSRNKKIWLTEVSWPASRGRAKPTRYQKPQSDAGMAQRVKAAYRLLGSRRVARRWGLTRVYWYTWATNYPRKKNTSIFNFSGLVRYKANSAKYKKMKALSAYRSVARELSGCAKTPTGRCK